MEQRFGTYSDQIEVLKNSPDISDVQKIVSELSSSPAIFLPTSETVPILTILIGTTLPQFYDVFKQASSKLQSLVSLLTSLPAINGIVSMIGLHSDALMVSPQDEVLRAKILVWADILHKIVSPSVLDTLYTQVQDTTKKQLYWQEIMSLFVGGKIISCMAKARLAVDRNEKDQAWWWMSDGAKMSQFLGLEVASSKHIPSELLAKLIPRCMNLGYSSKSVIMSDFTNNRDIFLAQLINADSFHILKSSSQELSSIECAVFTKSLLRYLQSVLSDSSSINKYVAASAAILVELIPASQEHIVLKLVLQQGIGTLPLHRSIVLWLVFHGLHENVLEALIKQWGDSITIKHLQLTRQEVQTFLIFLLLGHTSQSTVHHIAQEPYYLDAISNRLQAMSSQARFMGMGVAMMVNKLEDSNVSLNFSDVPGFSEVYGNWEQLVELKDKIADVDMVWSLLGAREVPAINKPFYTRTLPEEVERSDQSEVDSDDDEFPAYDIVDDASEDSDDDPTVRRKKVPPPVYLIDLIKYFNETDNNTALLKHKTALASASSIILRKAHFGSELEATSKELCTILCGLKNTYDISDFESQKLNAMVALVVSVPETAPSQFAESITFGDYSMQERLMMLSAIALGAQHLAGKITYDFGADDAIVFASSLLPEAVHARFITPEDIDLSRYGIGQIENAVRVIQKNSLQDTVTSAAESTVQEPGVLRISKRLLNERQKASNPTARTNLLAKIAGRAMFFPLAAHWRYFTISISRNSFGAILVAHYIKTMAIILNASYPLAPNILDMSMELLSIVSTIRRDPAESTTFEAILTAILVIVDVNDEDVVISTFSKELIEFKDYLEATWESITDKQVHSLAAGVLIKVTQLLAKYQRRLIGEYSSMG